MKSRGQLPSEKNTDARHKRLEFNPQGDHSKFLVTKGLFGKTAN